jgi:hypothetical protein
MFARPHTHMSFRCKILAAVRASIKKQDCFIYFFAIFSIFIRALWAWFHMWIFMKITLLLPHIDEYMKRILKKIWFQPKIGYFETYANLTDHMYKFGENHTNTRITDRTRTYITNLSVQWAELCSSVLERERERERQCATLLYDASWTRSCS